MEFLSPEGLRLDGRRAAELRRTTVDLGVLPHADGSAWVEAGNTRVLAAVFGPYVAPGSRSGGLGGADLRCEVSTAAFSTGERRRQAARRDRRAAEASATVQAALASTALLHLLPPASRVDVAVQVLQADGGGALAAAITAAGAALADAGIPMRGVLGAAGATALDGAPLLDPNQAETGAGGASALVAAHAGALAQGASSGGGGGGGGGGGAGDNANAIVAWQVDGGPAAGVEEVEALTRLAADGAAAVGGLVRDALFASAARCAAGRAASGVGVMGSKKLAQAGGGGADGGGDAEMVGE